MKKLYIIFAAFILMFISACTSEVAEDKTLITDRNYLPDSFVFEDLGEISFAKAKEKLLPEPNDYKKLNKKGSEQLEQLFNNLTPSDIQVPWNNNPYESLYHFKFSQLFNSKEVSIAYNSQEETYYVKTFDMLDSNLESSSKLFECDQDIAAMLIKHLDHHR